MERWLQHSQEELWSSPYSADYRLRGDQDLGQQHARVMPTITATCCAIIGRSLPMVFFMLDLLSSVPACCA